MLVNVMIGLPIMNILASQLHLSLKYLSDLLKQETDKTALELIHLYVISEEKTCLRLMSKVLPRSPISSVLKIPRILFLSLKKRLE